MLPALSIALNSLNAQFKVNVVRGNTIDVVYSSIFDQWKIANKSDNSINSTEIYGTSRVNAYEIMESSLNQKRVAVRDPVEYIKKNGDKGIKYILNIPSLLFLAVHLSASLSSA